MSEKKSLRGRPYISVFFKCCQVYQRVYKHKDGDRYEGRCPKCLARLKVPIGEGGTDQRSFVAE